MKLEILKATRSWSNESEGENMAGCLAHNERVVAYFPTESAMENHARLLAAAPELLAALRFLMREARAAGVLPQEHCMQQAASSIAKVEGGAE
jgi:hypothetical protein